MDCRPHCAACCIAPSIAGPIPASAEAPGMPRGKPAGVPCTQLDPAGACRLFGHPERPAVCASLQPSAEMCGSSREQALSWLAWLEGVTTPGVPPC